jgi:hypothetical protein
MDQTVLQSKYDFPVEIINLPSKGLLYPNDSILSSGQITMRYMTAKHEDILTNESYIKSGIVIDKLLEALVVDKINLDDLLIGDKNALLVAARILGYGKDYTFSYKHPSEKDPKQITVDLSKLPDKELKEDIIINKRENRFKCILSNGIIIEYKLLTQKDEKNIDEEIKNLKKLYKDSISESVIRLKHTILSINGDIDPKNIIYFIENKFLAKEAREFRKIITEITPDVNLTFTYEGERFTEEGISIPLGVNFFYPDAGT